MKLTTLSAAIALALSAGAANAAMYYTTGNNFTMLNGTGGLQGGTNDVTFGWDGTYRTSLVTNGTFNATLSSPTAFFGKLWTAHNVNIYAPGTYVFDTTASIGNPVGTGTAAQKYTLVVPSGYIGAHMLFDYGTNLNIDVVQLWKSTASWAGTDQVVTGDDPFCAAPLTGGACNTNPNPNGNTANTVFGFMSIDTPASTIARTSQPMEDNVYHGTKMIDGPFGGSSANFNLMSAVPVPAAAWLLGSGLLGLVGVARRKQLV